jgi:hypothetical protein
LPYLLALAVERFLTFDVAVLLSPVVGAGAEHLTVI